MPAEAHVGAYKPRFVPGWCWSMVRGFDGFDGAGVAPFPRIAALDIRTPAMYRIECSTNAYQVATERLPSGSCKITNACHTKSDS
ncbi:hypothetical protein CBM2587_A80004 [Cupriavidus taiwanensis]|uniref:Uncharacterized protein n=1 Tax=Cupriavidus taiwanensis TaxID=164546 RepID=A0A976A317_9BURK|nr:hypothetical protein CBM2587_A80004 [Cupriavidus taiwanensis]